MSNSEPPPFDPIEGESGVVLKRDKYVGRKFQWLMAIPGLFFLLMALVTLVAGLLASGAAATGTLAAAGASFVFALVFGFLWSTLSVVRTVLTNEALHVKVGLWGPRIALERIEDCRIVQETRRLSVGKRYEDGQMLSRFVMAMGDQVQVAYRDEDGDKRTLRFTASDAQGLVRAVQRARGLRIDTSDVGASKRVQDDAANAARETEAEREAQAEAELEKRQARE